MTPCLGRGGEIQGLPYLFFLPSSAVRLKPGEFYLNRRYLPRPDFLRCLELASFVLFSPYVILDRQFPLLVSPKGLRSPDVTLRPRSRACCRPSTHSFQGP